MLQPVIWHKGAFLTPQHLQAQDRFLESMVQFRVEALQFRPWGFRQLQVNQEALAAGAFALHQARGLLPDGLPFDIPHSDPAPPARPLAGAFGPDQKSLDIYLAIPDRRESGANVSMPQRGLETRYLAELATLRDENTGASEKAIQLARKNFRLLFEGEPRRGAVAMRVARVLPAGAGGFRLDPEFVPPMLDFTASDSLAAMTRRLIELLASKSGMLAGLRRQKNQSLAEFTTADIANFWLLYTVNSYFPLLRHLLESKRGHPEELFSTMIALASALTTFSLDLQPQNLPAYDHDDLSRCFGDLDAKLRHLIETAVPSNFVSLPLKLISPSVYAAAGFEDRFLENTRMYLALQAEMDEAELIQKVPQLVKVCSASHIEHLIRQALPGLPLTHVASTPTAIPIKVNHQYFSLTQSGLAWEAILRARNIAAYIPGDFHNPQAELLILLPST